MALVFNSKNYAEILRDTLNRIPNDIDKRSTSITSIAVRPFAWTVEGIYLDLEFIFKNAYVQTAVGEYLEYLAAMRGIYRRPATAAIRRGHFDAPITIGTRFRTPTGDNSVNFTVTELFGLQPDNYYHANLTCETLGVVGNEYSGYITSLTHINGLGYAYLSDIIVAGSDAETDDELRQRYLDSLLRQPFAGNIAAYIDWFLSGTNSGNRNANNVGAVQVYPFSTPTELVRNGHVTCSAIGRDYLPLNSTIIDELQYDLCPPEAGDINPSNFGYGYAPIGAIAHVVTPTEFTINIDVTLELRSGYTASAVQGSVESKIEDYLLEVRKTWAQLNNQYYIDYSKIIYQTRMIVAILSVEGVLNVTSISLNGVSSDITLVETSIDQQLPVLGTVNISV